MSGFDNKLLKLHPNTVETIRKMYNLDKSGDMDRAIDVLVDWLSHQHHLTRTVYPREFLERLIIFMKGSVERAKSQIESLCAIRAVFPNFFDKYDARNDFEGTNSIIVDALLPTLTKDHYRIYVISFKQADITKDNLMDIYRFGILKCEYVMAHDNCNGFVGILDYRNTKLGDLITMENILTLQQYTKVIMEGYRLRVKAIHGITSSKSIELLVKLIKPILGSKVANRVYVHTSVETLYDHVSRDILPPELGGYGESLISVSEQWKDTLGTKENIDYMKEMSKTVSKEPNKTKEKLKGLDSELSGTFRTLSID